MADVSGGKGAAGPTSNEWGGSEGARGLTGMAGMSGLGCYRLAQLASHGHFEDVERARLSSAYVVMPRYFVEGVTYDDRCRGPR